MTEEVFYGHYIHCVSYYTSWQVVRLSLDFTLAGYKGTLAKLRVYADKAKDDTDRQYRVYRIRNLLNAIPFGQTTLSGIRSFNDERKPFILAERRKYREEIEEVGRPTFWDWNWTREDTVQYNFRVRDLIFTDIMYRANRIAPKSACLYYFEILETTEWIPSSLLQQPL